MNFEFATANRILFGPGALREVVSLAMQSGDRVLLVTGRSPDRAGVLINGLRSEGMAVSVFAVSGEPGLETVQQGVRRAEENNCAVIVGFGGGSVIDAGKAVAALMANGGVLSDYLEVIGKGKLLSRPSLPYIAIPTTAGSGAEVTRNAVLTSAEHRVKVSLRSPFMLPRAAVVDPELTRSLPPSLTATTGMDALTQLIEPFVSNSANPLTDAICREGMLRVARALRAAFQRGDDIDARTDMSLAALFGGLALANAKLGAVHGLASPLGGLLSAPHGAVCARLLPIVAEANLKALQRAPSGAAVLSRYSEVAWLLTGKPKATPLDGVDWLRALCRDLEIPALSQYGLQRDSIPAIVAQATKAGSMKGNPISLTEMELSNILEQAIG